MPESDEDFERRKRIDIAAMAADEDFLVASRDWLVQSARHRYSYNFRWLGLPIIQYPADIIALQELVWQLRPRVIVETGVARGGSLVFYASLLELIGDDGFVIGVELALTAQNRAAITAHPMARRIRLVDGSSIAAETILKVKSLVVDKTPIMVILDSHHSHDHVLAELRAYGTLVTEKSYMVVLDTVIEHLPKSITGVRSWDKGNNPMTAIQEFLKENSHFEIDKSFDDRLILSVCPQGFLRRVRL